MVAEVSPGPGPGDHDHRAHVPQLARDRAPVARRARALALRGRLTLAPDHPVVGRQGAGDVDGVDPLVLRQPLPHLGAAVHDPQQVGVHQGPQRHLQHGAHGLVHRVHLEQGALAVGEELVEHVEGADRRHVPRSEDERHPGLAVLGPLRPRHVRRELLGRDPGVLPDLGRDPAQQDPIQGVGREDGRAHLAGRERARDSGESRGAAGRHVLQGANQLPRRPQHRVGPAEPLLGLRVRAARHPLEPARRVHPGLGLRLDGGQERLEHAHLLLGGRPAPAGRPGPERGDGRVLLRLGGGRQRARGAGRCGSFGAHAPTP